MILLFLFFVTIVYGRCIWKPPSTMFPEKLLHLNMVNFNPGRRLANPITVINGQPNGMAPVVVNVYEEKNANGIKHSNAVPEHSNAVPGQAHYRTNKFTGGLNDQGVVEYSVVFDKRFATPDMLYDIVDVIPSEFYSSVSLLSEGPEIVVVNFKREQLSALEFVDVVRVGVGVRSPCLSERELGRVYYDFNVSATYDLYHSYNNTLVSSDNKEWTSGGWISRASIVTLPPFILSGEHINTPCMGSRFESSLEILNTSQFTYWDHESYSYKTDKAFIGNLTHSIPRCHRRIEGNVCVVLAKVKLTFGECPKRVSFSIRQAVSHIARMSRNIHNPNNKPDNFNVHRRTPIADGLDMRYDMCEARACQSPDNCQAFHIENDGLKADGGIYINQYDTHAATYLETICTFEVIGFLDNIWSPHIYFRQWVGFNWTMID